MEPEQQLRNLRDFLLVYNRMTEICFNKCASNLNYRSLTMEEESCLENCAGKLIRSNHRLMGSYVNLMPAIVQRRVADYESKAMEGAQKSSPVLPSSTALGTLPQAVDESLGPVVTKEQLTSSGESSTSGQDSVPPTSS